MNSRPPVPAKRKQVLVNILGLAYYDGFEAQAKDIVKQREMLRAQLDGIDCRY